MPGTAAGGLRRGCALLLMLAHTTRAAEYPPRSAMALALKQQNTQPAMWFTQKLDHFKQSDTRTFDQKYYYNDAHFRDPSGPVFFYMSGEAPLYGAPHSGSLIDELAEEHGAMVVALEHRYYGESLPFTLLDLENLSYLNSGQSLLDMAAFRQYFQEVLKNKWSSQENPWFVFGGSYAGALASWFRAKFPWLVKGALASSGVVEAMKSYTEFDVQVAKTVGPDCAYALRKAQQEIDTMLADPQQNAEVKAAFEASGLYDGDFRFMLADSHSMAVQYGYTSIICDPLVGALSHGQDVVAAFANYTRSFFYPTLEQGGAREYSVQYLGQERIDPEMTGRQWRYQQCAELGWFQNAPARSPIRSPFLNEDYQRQACAKIFGEGVWPDTDSVNYHYGGRTPQKVTNVLFTQGGQDPWQWAGIRESLSPSLPAMVIDCPTCSHCVDLKHVSDDDPIELRQARETIKAYVRKWLHE